MSDLFRKSSLEKLSSPEQLDRAIVLTPPAFWVALLGGFIVVAGAVLWAVFGRIPVNVDTQGIYLSGEGTAGVYAQTEGIVTEVNAAVGDEVKAGNVVAIVGGEDITAFNDGVVQEVVVERGDVVAAGSPVIKLRLGRADSKEVLCYMPLSDGKKIAKGMEVMVYPTTVNKQEYGHMTATVKDVATYVTSQEEMLKRLGDETLVQAFLANGPVVAVVCALEEDSNTASGYKWSSKKGAEVTLADGTMLEASVITEKKAPITMVIPLLKQLFSESATATAEVGAN